MRKNLTWPSEGTWPAPHQCSLLGLLFLSFAQVIHSSNRIVWLTGGIHGLIKFLWRRLSLSLSSSSLNFSGSPLLLHSPTFYNHPSPLLAILLLVRFREILIPLAHSPAISWSWRQTLGVSSLFKLVIQHLMWLTLGEESLKCGGDCDIGFYVFINMFLGGAGEEMSLRQRKWVLLDWATFPWGDGLHKLPRYWAQMVSSQ